MKHPSVLTHSTFKIFLVAMALLISITVWMGSKTNGEQKKPSRIVVFTADSLDLFFESVKHEFQKTNPEVEIIIEPSGSVLAGRKITHGRHCDVIAVADNRVIDELIPDYATYRIDFATNAIVIGGTQMSRYIHEINRDNWYRILLRKDVLFGRANPMLDPCGYWTLLSWKLAGKYYQGQNGGRMIFQNLMRKSPSKGRYVLEDSQKLLSLVEGTGGLDYVFVYRSQAIDHRLLIVNLPSEINLSESKFKPLYEKVSIEIPGHDNKPEVIAGKTIQYSITLLNDCKNHEIAQKLIKFILDEPGQKLLALSGLPPTSPAQYIGPSNDVQKSLNGLIQRRNLQ